MNSVIKRLGIAATTGALVLSMAACGGDAGGGDTIKVGVLVAKTGPAAPYGAEEAAAIGAVADKVNSEGGINGKDIELVVKDSKTDATEAARLARQMILDDGVVAIIGGTTGTETHAFLETAAREEVPVFPMVGTISVTDPEESYSKWVFRMSVPLTVDLPASRKRIVDDGHKKVAVFYEEDAFGEQGSDLFSSLSKKAGDLDVVASVSAAKDATDLSTVATQLKNSKPDAIYMNTASPNSAGALMRAVRDAGMDQPIYGLAGIVQTATVEAGGEAANGLIAPALVNPDDVGPLAALFDLLEAKGGVEGFGALLGANAMAGVVAGLKSGATDGASLRDAMEKTGPIEGYAAAPIEFTADDHDSWGPDTLFFVEVKNKKFVNVDE